MKKTTPDQIDLFAARRDREAPKAAAKARDRAIDQVERHADDEWMKLALQFVERVARAVPTFSPDDVWALGLPTTREPRAFGAVMQKAKRAGFCEPTIGFVTSKREKVHATPIRVWRSKIFTGAPR